MSDQLSIGKGIQDLRKNMKDTVLVGICGQSLEVTDASGSSSQLYQVKEVLLGPSVSL